MPRVPTFLGCLFRPTCHSGSQIGQYRQPGFRGRLGGATGPDAPPGARSSAKSRYLPAWSASGRMGRRPVPRRNPMTRFALTLLGLAVPAALSAAPALKTADDRILYVAGDPGDQHIYAVKVDGTGTEKLT